MIRKNMFFVICIVIVLTLTSCSSVDCTYTDSEYYQLCLDEIYESEKYMPALDELGDYESILINYHPVKNRFFATTESLAVALTYSSEDYVVQKGEILSRYNFLQSTTEQITDVTAEIEGIRFNIVKCIDCTDDSCDHFVNEYSFMTIGIDDANSRIIYLFHIDIEVHSIENLDIFIEQSFYLKGII